MTVWRRVIPETPLATFKTKADFLGDDGTGIHNACSRSTELRGDHDVARERNTGRTPDILDRDGNAFGNSQTPERLKG